MTERMKSAAGWTVFAAASAALIAACYLNMHSYRFNEFMLLLLTVPAVMLVILGRIFGSDQERRSSRLSKTQE